MNVGLTRHAKRDLEALAISTRGRIVKVLRNLALDPSSVDLKKLAGEEDLYRIRVGDYRAIVQLGPEADTAYVLRVDNRREAYR
jgi:mRNA interferase RelE/StbE